MDSKEQIIKESIALTTSRIDLWIHFLSSIEVKKMVELGVYKGDFASKILEKCDFLEKYYMIDPWRHLENWNKPANKSDEIFEQFLSETKAKTDFAADKRIILRGKTTEVVENIPDGELDFAYIDGDHTLKGITIDLISLFPKIKAGGWIGGDDFSSTIWQHQTIFEPTLVFPFAIYFAEAVGARIFALPYSQFLIEKTDIESFSFVDLTNSYGDVSLRKQFHPENGKKIKLRKKFPFLIKASKK
jgi:hypothetical protein